MVIMQKLNRQLRVPDNDVEYARAKGYTVVEQAVSEATLGADDTPNEDDAAQVDDTPNKDDAAQVDDPQTRGRKAAKE